MGIFKKLAFQRKTNGQFKSEVFATLWSNHAKSWPRGLGNTFWIWTKCRSWVKKKQKIEGENMLQIEINWPFVMQRWTNLHVLLSAKLYPCKKIWTLHFNILLGYGRECSWRCVCSRCAWSLDNTAQNTL